MKEKQAGVKFSDGWYFTITEMADRYACSESLIRKRVTYHKLEPKQALGHLVYKDDPTIFVRKPKGPAIRTVDTPNGVVKIGSYGELFLLTKAMEISIKELYQKVIDLETKIAEGNVLLLTLLDDKTSPNHENRVSAPDV